MALKATIFKADLNIADMDRHYYGSHALTIARHPSETDERMMMRVLAFALHASESLAFGKGLSADDEPDLWQKDLTGAVQLWIDVGQPDERRLLKACGRAEQVVVYSYSGTQVWWGQMGSRLERARQLKVYAVAPEASQALGALAQRTMQLQCTIQDGQVWFTAGEASVHLEPVLLKDAAGPA
ncbi:YaeQ family protein [Oxalobacteraceae bacterium OM1]|nr:YaeQ family protein [Oxalobacteraceae bacterium OM1]